MNKVYQLPYHQTFVSGKLAMILIGGIGMGLFMAALGPGCWFFAFFFLCLSLMIIGTIRTVDIDDVGIRYRNLFLGNKNCPKNLPFLWADIERFEINSLPLPNGGGLSYYLDVIGKEGMRYKYFSSYPKDKTLNRELLLHLPCEKNDEICNFLNEELVRHTPELQELRKKLRKYGIGD
ncbi:hypothetical protein [Lactococcus hircilactis]|uniref:hypothetical protein n=1 Tax=Lactococcus hircilactis TaxID=1494462 RepID=UPI003FA1CA35